MTAGARSFRVYAQGLALLIPALTGLVLGVLGFYKGGTAEGKATVAQADGEKIWIRLRDKVNEQSRVINRLHLRLVAMQARQEERTASQILAQLEELRRRYDALIAKGRRESRSKPVPRVKAAGSKPTEQRPLIPALPDSYRKH